MVEVGPGVTTHKIGDFVASESHIALRPVPLSVSAGQAHVCVNTRILGVDVDGGFGPFAVIPATNAVHTDTSIPPRIAAFQDALGNAVHTAMAGPVEGQTLLITGMGPIGMFAVSVCRALGAAKIYATEVSPYRIAIAEQLGVDVILNPAKENAKAALQRLEPGGVDGVLEMSGHPSSLDLAMAAVRPGGRLSLLGVYASSPQPLDVNAVIFEGLEYSGYRRSPIVGHMDGNAEAAGVWQAHS